MTFQSPPVTEIATAERRAHAAPKAALSVIIATHNRADFLDACLDALAPQAARPDVQVIVVDSCCDPEAAKRARAAADRYGFQAIRLDEPGVSKARNAGASIAT